MITAPAFDAIVLAGGRARRLAGADKPAELVGGRRLLDIALDAVAGAERIVVVGPDRELPDGILVTREQPAYGGPGAALAAGLRALNPVLGPVVVIAADLPEVTGALIDRLREELARTGAPAVFATDDARQIQYLLGIWTPEALRPAHDAGPDASMRGLLPSGAQTVPLDGTADVDTPDDLAAARRRAAPTALDPDAARAAVATLPALPFHRAPLTEQPGTVLAEPLTAARAFPPFDASAMDGYAVAGPPPWTLVDRPRAAGHVDDLVLAPGQASPIATGAALPRGADRAIRHEELHVDGDRLGPVPGAPADRDDTRRTASAWPAGAQLAPAGAAVDAAVASVALAAGVEEAAVRGPLRARLHTSGDEIAPPGAGPLAHGAVPDTASGPVRALLQAAAVTVTDGGHLADTPEAFRAALAAGGTGLIVVIGATGRGVADHLRAALAAEGADILVDGVRMRPGGSLLVARLPGGAVLLGLGGNPLAAVSGTALLAPALSDALLARNERPRELLDVTGDEHLRLPGRWRVLPVEPDGAGRWTVTAGTGTGHLASAIGYRGLALIPPAESGRHAERLH